MEDYSTFKESPGHLWQDGNLEGIIRSDISQTEHTVWSHLYVESKKAKLTETESKLLVATAWG